MHKKFAQVPVYFALVIIIAAMILTGCSSSSTTSTPASTPSDSGQQTQQQGSQQQGGQQQGGKQGGQDMQAMQTKLLARVAEILGVSTDKLTTAYESAMKSVMGDKAPSSGQQGGTPPSGSSQGTPPQPPSDNRTGGGPGGQGGPGGGKGGPDMSGVYAKVATELGLTTETVQAAFEQAQKELMPAQTSK